MNTMLAGSLQCQLSKSTQLYVHCNPRQTNSTKATPQLMLEHAIRLGWLLRVDAEQCMASGPPSDA
jgi:hypothetical protein